MNIAAQHKKVIDRRKISNQDFRQEIFLRAPCENSIGEYPNFTSVKNKNKYFSGPCDYRKSAHAIFTSVKNKNISGLVMSANLKMSEIVKLDFSDKKYFELLQFSMFRQNPGEIR